MSDVKEYKTDVYKKWFKTKDRQGFLSLKDLLERSKVVVDIGEQKAGQELKTTQTYLDPDVFSVILNRLLAGDLAANDSIIIYGGGRIDGNPVSRIFKVECWNGDTTSWSFKNGMFQANETGSGAFKPMMDKPISTNMIKMNKEDVGKMQFKFNLLMQRFAVRFTDQESWKNDTLFLKALNGELRG